MSSIPPWDESASKTYPGRKKSKQLKQAFLASWGVFLASLARNEGRELSDVADYSLGFVFSLHLSMTQALISTESSAL